MQQSSVLRRTPGSFNLRDRISKPGRPSKELQNEIKNLLNGCSPHDIIEHSPPESLLPLLSCLIRLKSSDEEIYTFASLREFSEFTAKCRKSAGPGKLIQSLPHEAASEYSTLLETFQTIILRERASFDVLRFIFKEELGVGESSHETKKMVLMVIADLPFNVTNWTNIWVGLIQGLWGGIWQATLFVRRLRDGKVLGKNTEWMPHVAREMQWVQWQIKRRAEETDDRNLRLRIQGSVGQNGLASRPSQDGHTGRRESLDAVSDTNILNVRPPSILISPPSPKQNLDVAMPAPNIPAKQSADQRGFPVHVREQRRPKVIYYSPSPPKSKPKPSSNVLPVTKPKPSEIDVMIGKYAQLPRVKYDQEEQIRQELARQQRSEEEFNVRLRKKYHEARIKEILDEMAKDSGLIVEGKAAKRKRDEDDEAGKIKRAGAIAELNELHRRLLEHEKELEDNSFENWAGKLLVEETDGEEEEEICFGEMFLKIVLIPPGVLSARRRVDRSVSIALGIVPAACTLRSSIPAACNLMQSIVNAAKPAASAVATEPPVILTDSSDPISTSSPGNNSSGTSVWLNFNVEWRKEQS
ncbi:hypothetical protein TWF217_012032 [Orbilia oligospora]|nr:hypothetical protein TWF217_012032 [Orbilia oligospora]